jgi:hypothetical protein
LLKHLSLAQITGDTVYSSQGKVLIPTSWDHNGTKEVWDDASVVREELEKMRKK